MIFRKPRPTGNDNLPVERSPTIIARDTSLEGVIESDGAVEIQGHFRGTVHARSCHVGDSGFVEGTIVADDVGVRGRVMGPIRSVQVHLMR
ncbi:MAG: polymer-forming cytoskeletal protein, partial [Hyphomicrobiales bacterium]